MKQFVLAMMMATAVCTTAFAQNKVKNIYASSSKLNIEMFNPMKYEKQNFHFFSPFPQLFPLYPFKTPHLCYVVLASKRNIQRIETPKSEAKKFFDARGIFEVFSAHVEGARGNKFEILVEKLFPRKFEVGLGDEEGSGTTC